MTITATTTNVAYNGFVNTDETTPLPQRKDPSVVGGGVIKREGARVSLC